MEFARVSLIEITQTKFTFATALTCASRMLDFIFAIGSVWPIPAASKCCEKSELRAWLPFCLFFLAALCLPSCYSLANSQQAIDTPLASQEVNSVALVQILPLTEMEREQSGRTTDKSEVPAFVHSLAELDLVQSKHGLVRCEFDMVANLEFAASEWPFFFVGDGSSNAIIECHPSVTEVLRDYPLGQSLRIVGRTLPGKKPIQLRSFEILDQIRELQPHKLLELGPKSIPYTATLVELEFVVEQVLSSKDKCVFLGRSSGIAIEINLHHDLPPGQLLALVGRTLTARGVLGFAVPNLAIKPGDKMVLNVMHPSQLSITDPGLDSRTLESLESLEVDSFKKISGQVLFSDSKSQLIVRHNGENVEVATDFAECLGGGLEVSIYQREQTPSPKVLRHKSDLIVIGELSNLPGALKMSVADALRSTKLPPRIQFTATLESVERCKDGFLMQLQSENVVLVAKVPSEKSNVKELSFRSGDIVQIKGTPLHGSGQELDIAGHAFKLFVADDSEIQVVFSPQPWRTRHFVIIAISSICIIGVSLSVNYLLRRKVIERTAELHDASSNWQKAMEAIRKGVILTDERNRITIFNQNFVNLFGFQPQQGSAIDQTIRDISKLVVNKSEIDDAERYARSKDPISGKWLVELQMPDRTISMTSTPLLENNGIEFRGSLWSFEDISESVRIESELVQAQRMDAVGQLSGGIAHDFNNLLTIIRSSVRLVRDMPDNKDGNIEFFNAADTAIDRAADLTQHLLDISRRSTLKKTPMDLNDLLLKSFQLIRRSIDATHEIKMELEPCQIPVEIDATRIEQVLINLCVNARDALPTSKGRIDIKSKTRFADDGQLQAVVIVQDNGHGMSPEIAERIFEPFFTTKPVGAGTGLGLSMARGIVEQHGGRISFKTAPGVGTQFEISLPVSTPIQIAAASQTANAYENGDSLKILLVDDEDLIRATGCAILKSLGHTVLLATNGKEALDLLEQDSCDMVILDLSMPKMSGKEAFVIIQSRWPNLPVVVCSGYPVDFFSWASRLDKQPMLLRKPYSINEIAQMVNSVSQLKSRLSQNSLQ